MENTELEKALAEIEVLKAKLAEADKKDLRRGSDPHNVRTLVSWLQNEVDNAELELDDEVSFEWDADGVYDIQIDIGERLRALNS